MCEVNTDAPTSYSCIEKRITARCQTFLHTRGEKKSVIVNNNKLMQQTVTGLTLAAWSLEWHQHRRADKPIRMWLYSKADRHLSGGIGARWGATSLPCRVNVCVCDGEMTCIHQYINTHINLSLQLSPSSLSLSLSPRKEHRVWARRQQATPRLLPDNRGLQSFLEFGSQTKRVCTHRATSH